jgi:hypothetical protein
VVVIMGSVEEATKRDLEKLSPESAGSALGASALALAREMDSDSSATSKSMCAKAHLDLMNRLCELAPPAEKKGELHDIKSRRALRIASGGSGT